MVGRDIGTVVLPEADLKIYLDASAENARGDDMTRSSRVAQGGLQGDPQQSDRTRPHRLDPRCGSVKSSGGCHCA